jgi:hypothetical protein
VGHWAEETATLVAWSIADVPICAPHNRFPSCPTLRMKASLAPLFTSPKMAPVVDPT